MAKYWLDHIHLVADDPEGVMQFYVDNFGAEVVETRILADGRHNCEFLIGPTTFKVYQSTTQGELGRTMGLDHIGFGTDDVEAAAAQLRHRNAKVVSEPRQVRPGLKVCVALDACGIPIEILDTESK